MPFANQKTVMTTIYTFLQIRVEFTGILPNGTYTIQQYCTDIYTTIQMPGLATSQYTFLFRHNVPTCIHIQWVRQTYRERSLMLLQCQLEELVH